MILFLIPGESVYRLFKSMAEYCEAKPFEQDSIAHRQAHEILLYGGELHLGYYLTDEDLINHVVTFENEARAYIRDYAEPDSCIVGPVYVMTKGLNTNKISMLLDHMAKKNTASVLWLNSVVDADFNVNPYCLNKLE